MIEIIFSALLLVQPASATPLPPPARLPGEWCRGIHMPTRTGGINLLWTTVRGSLENVLAVREKMESLGATVSIQKDASELVEIRFSYRDDIDARALAALLNNIDAGVFGPLTTEDFSMSLDTLPANKCIRL